MSGIGRVLVTGASGLLGSNLTLEFAARGHSVVALYGSYPIRLEGVVSLACDLTDFDATSRLLLEHAPSLIVHCAAATNVDWCEDHPLQAMSLNASAAGHLAKYARDAGAAFVHISTDAVFDGVSGGYLETDPVSPLNQYARSKVAGEEAVLSVMPEALVLRVNLFGWNLQPKLSLAEWMLALLQQAKPVLGFTDTAFAPVLVNDTADWILHLIRAGCSGFYHVAASAPLSKFEFACKLAEVFELDRSLVHETLLQSSALSAPRPRHTWLRSEKLAAALGRPMPTIEQGLEKFRLLRENGFFERLKAAA